MQSYPEHFVQRAAEAYQSGLSITQVAQRMELSGHQVRGLLARAGVELRPRGGPPR